MPDRTPSYALQSPNDMYQVLTTVVQSLTALNKVAARSGRWSASVPRFDGEYVPGDAGSLAGAMGATILPAVVHNFWTVEIARLVWVDRLPATLQLLVDNVFKSGPIEDFTTKRALVDLAGGVGALGRRLSKLSTDPDEFFRSTSDEVVVPARRELSVQLGALRSMTSARNFWVPSDVVEAVSERPLRPTSAVVRSDRRRRASRSVALTFATPLEVDSGETDQSLSDLAEQLRDLDSPRTRMVGAVFALDEAGDLSDDVILYVQRRNSDQSEVSMLTSQLGIDALSGRLRALGEHAFDHTTRVTRPPYAFHPSEVDLKGVKDLFLRPDFEFRYTYGEFAAVETLTIDPPSLTDGALTP